MEKCSCIFSKLERKQKQHPKFVRTAFKKIVSDTRCNNKRNEKTSFCILDAQSVKNTDTAEKKGYDAGKKVSGIKCHIAVDTQGLPCATNDESRCCIKDEGGPIDSICRDRSQTTLSCFN